MKYKEDINILKEKIHRKDFSIWANFYKNIYKNELSIKFDSIYQNRSTFAIPIILLRPNTTQKLKKILKIFDVSFHKKYPENTLKHK